jgi:uncharacterized repeat protein (TIGR01451 family)
MRKRTSLITILALALLAATSAWSAGTPAGVDRIKNTAHVTYYDSNGTKVGDNVASNEVATTVTQVAGVSVAAGTVAGSGANNTVVYYAVDVINTGNGDDTIDFTVATSAGWNPAAITVYNDVDDNDAYTAGTDTLILPASYNTGLLAADEDFDIIVGVTVPDGDVAVGGTTNTVTVTGTARFGLTPSDSVDLTTTANAAIVDVDLVAGDLSPVPGQVITFTATLTNSGNAASGNVSFSNLVPGSFTFVPGSILVNGAAGGAFGAATVTATVPSIAAAGTATIAFQATLNLGVAAATAINVTSDISHLVGLATLTDSDTEALVVAAGSALSVTMGANSDTKTPGDVTSFTFDVTNGGSVNDTFDLDANGGAAGYTYIFGTDATCSSAIVVTPSLAPGATATYYVCATVPNTAVDGTSSVITITVTSATDATKTFTSGNLTTTVTAPNLSIVKAVDLASAAPGDTLTYTITITNNGSGNATAILITDVVPTYTTYKPGTIQAGFAGSVASKNDAANSDGAQFNAGTVSAGDDGLTINLDNSAGVNKTYILSYQVTVD